MRVRFHSAEAAALFAAQRQNEGYFAEVVDTSTACLWGPATIGGILVLTSEEAVEDEADAWPELAIPAPGSIMRRLRTCVRVIFVGAACLAICIFLLSLLLFLLVNPLAMLRAGLILLAFFGAATGMALFYDTFLTSALRQERLGWLLSVLLIPVVFTLLAGLALAKWG